MISARDGEQAGLAKQWVNSIPLLASLSICGVSIRFEIKITGGTSVGAGRAVLRDTAWKGDDLPFKPTADGQWHEYAIKCTKSDAWPKWTPEGRIGIALPVPTEGEIVVELKTVRLEK